MGLPAAVLLPQVQDMMQDSRESSARIADICLKLLQPNIFGGFQAA